jgi:hypothetical protein
MIVRSLLLACLLLSVQHQANAQESMASEASIRELLVLTDAKKMIDGMWTQMDSMMEASMKQALAGQTVTAAQQTILDDMRKKMVVLMQDELSWTFFEPLMMEIYRTSFTENEVQGMLQFYASPAGKAVIAKMPAIMQASMQAAQGRVASFQPKMRRLQEETIRKLEEASAQ